METMQKARIEIEVPGPVLSFLREYSAIKDMKEDEVVRGLVIGGVRGLIDDLTTEERAKLLGLGELF